MLRLVSRIILFFLTSIVGIFSAISTTNASMLAPFTPGPTISLTGSNGEVFFDVADDIFISGSTISRPILDTASSTFSGAFYLSGAGWVDFSTGAYAVSLDCGGQTLDSLTATCTLSGVAYGELVGDILFDRHVNFDPQTGLLSGTATTYMGDYNFDSIILPLLPTEFQEGFQIKANHQKNLTISGAYRFDGPGTWRIHIEPYGAIDALYAGSPYDFSHASMYRIEIIDPNDSSTVMSNFEVIADSPAISLGSTAGTVHETFCVDNPTSSLCPDGASLKPTELSMTKSANPVVGNGTDTYGFILRLRDQYGNMVDTGSLRIDYSDTIRDIQDIGPFPYIGWGSGWTIQTSGDLHNFLDGVPTTGEIPANLGGLAYMIASIAPTSLTDTLTLSGVIYTDTVGAQWDITSPAWKVPLTFTPWYTTSLSVGPLIVGERADFTSAFTNTTPSILASTPTGIYNIAIGANNFSSFSDFSSTGSISCTKYMLAIGTAECNWFGSPDPVIVSTSSSLFSGMYTPASFEPPPEAVSYSSYITYETGGIRILYPSGTSNLGTAIVSTPRIKILGQYNLKSLSSPGVGDTNHTDIWNALHKKIALLSRNRTNYADANYEITTGNISLDATSFGGPIKKRTLVSLGGNITITGNIPISTSPLAVLALTDSDGNGGNIMVESGVTDVHATLFAEKSLFSTGVNQLYIQGSIISHNSISNSVCPYYLSLCVDPEKYNLENLRVDYLTTPGALSDYSTSTGNYGDIPFLIEYDGRIISDPPPGLEK